MRFLGKIKLFKKKEKIVRKGFTANSYSHLRKQQKKKLSVPNLGLPSIKSPRFRKRLLFIPLIILTLISIFLFITQTNFFSVENISYSQEVSPEISEYLETRYLGRNIFGFSVFEIEEYLLVNVANVETAIVRKVPPNKIEVDITFQNPKYIYATFSEIGVLTTDFQIIEVESLDDPVVLSKFQKDLYLGIEDKNAKDIEDYFFKNLTPEKREELILEKDRVNLELEEDEEEKDLWDVVSDSEKEEILVKIKGEVFAKLDAFTQFAQDSDKLEKYPQTNLVFIFSSVDIGMSNSEITSKLSFAEKVIQVLEANQIEYSLAKWLTDVNFQIVINNNKTLIFNDTIEKSIDTQLEDLATVIYNRELEKGSVFDFRTKNYSIY